MLQCINNSGILKSSLELVSIGDHDDHDNIVKNEFKNMCSRFGLNGTQMIALVTTLDTTLLNDHYATIWDGLNYYSMACMDDYKTTYIESLYKTDLMDERINLLCDDLQEYIKCNSCINIKNKCSTFKNACDVHHDECVKYLLNNPQKHDVKNDVYDCMRNYKNTNIIDYICACGGSLDVIKYLFEVQKKDCTNDAIDYASFNGYLDVVAYLFEVQKKDCTYDAINWASKCGHLEVLKYLLEIQKKDCTNSAIYHACTYGKLDVIKYLFETQKKYCTTNLINYACRSGNLDIAVYLFETQKIDYTSDEMDHVINYSYQICNMDMVKYLSKIRL